MLQRDVTRAPLFLGACSPTLFPIAHPGLGPITIIPALSSAIGIDHALFNHVEPDDEVAEDSVVGPGAARAPPPLGIQPKAASCPSPVLILRLVSRVWLGEKARAPVNPVDGTQ